MAYVPPSADSAVGDQSIVPGKARQSDLQHHFACTLWPAIRFFGLFEALQLTTNIDEDACDLGPDGHERPHHPFLGGNHLACLVLVSEEQGPAVPVFAALEPAKRAFGFVQ
jgi:hypothetical protein